MSIGAECGQYILQTHNSKKFLGFKWGGGVEHPNPPTLDTPVVPRLGHLRRCGMCSWDDGTAVMQMTD